MILRRAPRASGWSQLQASSETTDLWVVPQWDGKPERGPWMTDDGRRVVDVIANGQAESLSFRIWFEQSADSQGTQRGDMLWLEGLPIGIVSDRFVRELEKLNVAGWSTYRVSIRDSAGSEIGGYHGFVADVTGRSELVSRAWKAGRQMPVYLTTDRVVHALLAAGIDGLEHETATKHLPRR